MMRATSPFLTRSHSILGTDADRVFRPDILAVFKHGMNGAYRHRSSEHLYQVSRRFSPSVAESG
jgi:hypothetical protein